VPASKRGEAFEALVEILAREVNVKDVEVVASDAELVVLRGKPNFRSLGKVYGKRTPEAAGAAAALPPDALRALEGGESVSTGTFTFQPENVVVEREVVTDWVVRSDGPYVVALNPSLTEELRMEGLAREIVNRVQRLRKEAGYDYNTRIALSVSGDAEVLEAVGRFRGFVVGETLARRLETGVDLPDADAHEAVDLDGRNAVVSVRRSAPEAATEAGGRGYDS
jgi:isoleucyl-tRNA synthetase